LRISLQGSGVSHGRGTTGSLVTRSCVSAGERDGLGADGVPKLGRRIDGRHGVATSLAAGGVAGSGHGWLGDDVAPRFESSTACAMAHRRRVSAGTERGMEGALSVMALMST